MILFALVHFICTAYQGILRKIKTVKSGRQFWLTRTSISLTVFNKIERESNCLELMTESEPIFLHTVFPSLPTWNQFFSSRKHIS